MILYLYALVYLLTIPAALFLIGYWGLQDREGPQNAGPFLCAVLWPVALAWWGLWCLYEISVNLVEHGVEAGVKARKQKAIRYKKLIDENAMFRHRLLEESRAEIEESDVTSRWA